MQHPNFLNVSYAQGSHPKSSRDGNHSLPNAIPVSNASSTLLFSPHVKVSNFLFSLVSAIERRTIPRITFSCRCFSSLLASLPWRRAFRPCFLRHQIPTRQSWRSPASLFLLHQRHLPIHAFRVHFSHSGFAILLSARRCFRLHTSHVLRWTHSRRSSWAFLVPPSSLHGSSGGFLLPPAVSPGSIGFASSYRENPRGSTVRIAGAVCRWLGLLLWKAFFLPLWSGRVLRLHSGLFQHGGQHAASATIASRGEKGEKAVRKSQKRRIESQSVIGLFAATRRR